MVIITSQRNLTEILNIKEFFYDKLGEIDNYEIKLKLNPEIKPVFCRVKIVPFALKGRVEDEIDKLEKGCIVTEKVENSD